MSRQFDRFMVAVNAAQRPKVKRLKRAGKEVRWAWFHGVLAIAAEAPIRGCFLVGDLPADEHDVADMADVTVAEARKAIEVGRALGMLYRDEENDCERVHDWDAVNPAPKQDKTAAERQARRRDRIKAERDTPVVTPASRRDVTGVTPPEVKKGEGNNPPDPPRGGRSRDIAEYEERLAAWSASVVPEADAHYCLPGVKHAISAISASRSMPTAESVRWYAANGSVNAFGLSDDVRAVIRSEFPTQAKETAA